MLQKTQGGITNRQSRKTVNRGYTSRRKTRQRHNTICVGHHYAQTVCLAIYINGPIYNVYDKH